MGERQRYGRVGLSSAMMAALLVFPSVGASQEDGEGSSDAEPEWTTVESKRSDDGHVRVEWQVTRRELASWQETTDGEIATASGRLVHFRCIYNFEGDGKSGEARVVDDRCPSPYAIFSPGGDLAVVQREPASARLWVVSVDRLERFLRGDESIAKEVLAQRKEGEWSGELTSIGGWYGARSLTLTSSCCGSSGLMALDVQRVKLHRIADYGGGGKYGQAHVFDRSPDGSRTIVRRGGTFHVVQTAKLSTYLIGRSEPEAAIEAKGPVSEFNGWRSKTAFAYETEEAFDDEGKKGRWIVRREGDEWTTRVRDGKPR